MNCPNCNREVPDGKRFCGHCGQKLEAPERFDDNGVTRVESSNCNGEVPDGKGFCGHCGQKQEAPERFDDNGVTRVESSNCNGEVPDGKGFCGHCGQKLEAPERFDDNGVKRVESSQLKPKEYFEESPTTMAEAIDESPGRKEGIVGDIAIAGAVTCPICGNDNLPDVPYCSYCTAPLKESPSQLTSKTTPEENEGTGKIQKDRQKPIHKTQIFFTGLFTILMILLALNIFRFYSADIIKLITTRDIAEYYKNPASSMSIDLDWEEFVFNTTAGFAMWIALMPVSYWGIMATWKSLRPGDLETHKWGTRITSIFLFISAGAIFILRLRYPVSWGGSGISFIFDMAQVLLWPVAIGIWNLIETPKKRWTKRFWVGVIFSLFNWIVMDLFVDLIYWY